MKSALLFRLGGLGDLMVAFPSIYLLRKKLSSWSLTLVCRKEYGLILKETGLVDEIFSLEQKRLTSLFSPPPFSQELTQWSEEFSLILGWMQKESSLNHKELCSFLGRERCHFIVPDPDYPGQISNYLFEKTLEYLTEKEGPRPSFSDCTLLPLSSSQKEIGLMLLDDEHTEGNLKIKDLKEKTAVVHPGSGSKSKCWPLEDFMEIIHRLGCMGFRGTLITGLAETEMEDKLKRQTLPEKWIWLPNPPLLKLAGLLSASDLYLGNDSGITHLAAACGTKVIALFRNDLEAAWKPFGQTVVLSGESVSDISLHSVWKAVSQICVFR